MKGNAMNQTIFTNLCERKFMGTIPLMWEKYSLVAS